MLLITDLEGNVLAAWSGNGRSLAQIYPDNPEVQTQYLEYEFPDDPDVLRNPTAYRVVERSNQEPAYELKIPTIAELMSAIRVQRNNLLAECDWTQLPDSPITEEKKTEWATYRQQLRDFPATCDPNSPVWPVPPK